jgi:hypothetical protein
VLCCCCHDCCCHQQKQPTLFKPGGGLNFNMQQTAARTREGFAKISLPFKLGGGGGGSGGSGDGSSGGQS